MSSTGRVTGAVNSISNAGIPAQPTQATTLPFQNQTMNAIQQTPIAGIQLPQQTPMKPRERSAIPEQTTTEHKVGDRNCCEEWCLKMEGDG